MISINSLILVLFEEIQLCTGFCEQLYQDHSLFKTTRHRLDDATLGFSLTSRTIEKEPIDIVYTWVNGSDPAHEALVLTFQRSTLVSFQRLKPNRFEDWNTLKYSLRSVEKYVSWSRHIFIVTNGQVTSWLNLNNPRVSIVTHEEIFLNKSHLPTFSSPAIESNIHKINGLSRHFIYLNDDLFFTAPISKEDFFTNDNEYMIRLEEYEIYDCSKDCNQTDVNNGVCDDNCFTEMCEWDGEDCAGRIKMADNAIERDDTGIWLASILHTSYQLNKLFSPRRRCPATHAPVLIDKDIIIQLQNSLPEEWEQTSSHQVRHYNDMQYQFAYANYLLELSYLPGSKVKTQRLKIHDHIYTRISENITSIPSLNSYRQNLKSNIKFAMFGDSIEKELSKEMKNALRTKIDEFFTGLFPYRSAFEIQS